MNAAIVTDFASAPAYGSFEQQPVAREGEVLVRVRAAALSSLVKLQAAGKHYSSPASPPFVPGNDGVGLLPDGSRVYFLFPRAPFGSMAEQTVVPERNIVAVPDALSDEAAAAMANPGMASWAALLTRAHLVRGESVLVNGATGVAGQQAVQAARALGAARIVVTGRKAAELDALRDLGATDQVLLGSSADETQARLRTVTDIQHIDVVLDYLWGASALAILRTFAGKGTASGEHRVRFVQIGSISGEEIALPAHILRSSGLELLGSGLGSLSQAEILAALKIQYDWAASHGLRISTKSVPLSRVTEAWNTAESGTRTVLIP
jgi:NADPH:quinone reductase-like Zn-dependent oxidoreductase